MRGVGRLEHKRRQDGAAPAAASGRSAGHEQVESEGDGPGVVARGQYQTATASRAATGLPSTVSPSWTMGPWGFLASSASMAAASGST